MAEQDLEYILHEPEYKEFQESKAHAKRLMEQLHKSKLQSSLKLEAIRQFEKQLATKNEEVNFFQALIEQIGRTNASLSKQQLIEITSTINQSVWEVVQQPDVQSKKARQRQLTVEKQKFFQRFQKYVTKVEEITDRLQSQQETISQLNHSIVKNNELLIGKTYGDLLKQLEKGTGIKLQSVENLKEVIMQSGRDRQERTGLQLRLKQREEQWQKERTVLQGKVKQREEQWQKERVGWQLRLKQKQEEVQKYKLNVQKLSPLVSIYYEKIKQLHGKIPAGEGAGQIRFLVDKLIKQIEDKQRSTGVGSKQVFNKINEQLTGVTTYIFKAIEAKMKS